MPLSEDDHRSSANHAMRGEVSETRQAGSEGAPSPEFGEAEFGVAEEKAGQALAVLAESLFLINLMLLPGIAFAILAGLWLKHRAGAPPLARQHLRQATLVSLWGGALIILLGSLIVLAGGLDAAWTWVVLILYFTCIHSTLILFGMYALIKAMAGQAWRYPLIGPHLE